MQARNEALDRPAPFLPNDPPSRVARWTGWLLLAAAASACVFAGVLRLPDVVTAPFLLAPENGTDPIQAPLAAEIATVRVHDGQSVHAGDELFTLRSDDIRNWQTRLRALREDQHSLAERGKRLEEAHTAELAIKDTEITQAEREVDFRAKYRDASSNFLAADQELGKMGVVSHFEIVRNELDLASAEKELVLGEKSRQQFLLQRTELEATRARERVEETGEAEKLKGEISTLERQLDHCTGDVKSVCAPYDAFVLSVRQHNAGNMVASGAELCQLARADSRAIVRLFLPEAGLPRLQTGQRVQLRFVAFPYQRYGAVQARLDWISQAAVNTPSGSTFEATATLLPDGPNVRINPSIGMSGEARIVVGHRTLLQKTLETFQTLRDNVKSQLQVTEERRGRP